MSEPLVPRKLPLILDTAAGIHWWCACGRSAKQPFCDGAHQGTGFEPLKVELPIAQRKAWCACKHTRKPPFCDGSHAGLG